MATYQTAGPYLAKQCKISLCCIVLSACKPKLTWDCVYWAKLPSTKAYLCIAPAITPWTSLLHLSLRWFQVLSVVLHIEAAESTFMITLEFGASTLLECLEYGRGVSTRRTFDDLIGHNDGFIHSPHTSLIAVFLPQVFISDAR